MAAGARAQAAPEERRASERVRVAWKVKAMTASGSVVTCTVQEVSEGGARLQVPPDAELPERFHLYYPLRDLSLFAEMRWRKGSDVGIAFVENLEAEMRELKALIAHLTDRLGMLERAAAMRRAESLRGV
ncbi:MAG TPA: PilZ domain-containing protein [Microvirga sp.]|jgi:hypothetical protein|nr:PilZ domain-containing protein [Microvirga sp.]